MSFAQGQDWSTAGWSSKGPATGANKQQALNKARRTGEVITEAKCTSLAVTTKRCLLGPHADIFWCFGEQTTPAVTRARTRRPMSTCASWRRTWTRSSVRLWLLLLLEGVELWTDVCLLC